MSDQPSSNIDKDSHDLKVISGDELVIVDHRDSAIARVNKSFIKLYQERQQQLSNLIKQLPSLSGLTEKVMEGKSYRAIIPASIRAKLRSGNVKWDKSIDGEFGALIRDRKTGQVVSQVKLEEISPDLLSKIDSLTVQQTLAEIINRLEVLDEKISSIMAGQKNDRLALVISGINLYHQAIAAGDISVRKNLLVSAIDKLTEGRQKLIISIDSEIQFIDKVPDTYWKMILKYPFKDVSKYVDKNAAEVQQTFQAIIRSSYVLALSYDALDETDSMRASFQPLIETINKFGIKGKKIGRFLPYNPEFPPEDLWHDSLAQLIDNINNAEKQINNPDIGTIEVSIELDDENKGEN